jgi:hypothetical protein
VIVDEEGPEKREELREERTLWITDQIAQEKFPEELEEFYKVKLAFVLFPSYFRLISVLFVSYFVCDELISYIISQTKNFVPEEKEEEAGGKAGGKDKKDDKKDKKVSFFVIGGVNIQRVESEFNRSLQSRRIPIKSQCVLFVCSLYSRFAIGLHSLCVCFGIAQ